MTDVFADLKPCRWCRHHPYFQRDDKLVSCFGGEALEEGCPIGGEDFTVEEWNLLTDTEFSTPDKLRGLITAFQEDQHPKAKLLAEAFQVLYTRLFPEVTNG